MTAINPNTDLTEILPTDYLRVHVAYADAAFAFNYFGQIYHPHARMWVQKRLADIIYTAAEYAYSRHGWHLIALDALRVTEAQGNMYAICERDFANAAAKMGKPVSDLVAPAGKGAHPRGWAVDLAPILPDGTLIDMGGHFDQFWRPFSLRARQFASRTSADAEILQRRADLEKLMNDAGEKHGRWVSNTISDEWWDFRPTPDFYRPIPPLTNDDLPLPMRLLPGDALPTRAVVKPELYVIDNDGRRLSVADTYAAHRPPLGVL
jgi:D-alanyl-D-alanine dipeptidase